MRIAVLSGKGGTGKSSLTSSLAHFLGSRMKIVLVDADSDCPNQHILFPGKTLEEYPISVSKLAEIDYAKCAGCGRCMEVCEFEAVKNGNGKYEIDEIGCEGCGACVVSCPQKAISLAPVESGSMIIKQAELFPLVYARLNAGKSGTGRMVHEARKLADKVAEERGAELILIDSPPGIGCPVIASITGCDLAIGVVEPTPASLANLKRALSTAGHFKIPYFVVLNKAGISKRHEQEIAKEFGELLIGLIPYDEEIPKLIAKGVPPIKGNEKAAKAFEEIAKKVGGMLEAGK